MNPRRTHILDELTTIVTGSTPPGDGPWWGEEIDYITPSDQTRNTREAVPSRRLSSRGRLFLQNREVCPLSTQLTCIGSTIGKVSMTRERCITNQQINSLVARPGVVDPIFLYYMISNWSPALAQSASGSATPIINKSVLGKFKFEVPALDVQRAIGELLGALDDKIWVNAAAARTVDHLVRARITSTAFYAEGTMPLNDLIKFQRSTVDPRGVDGATAYVGLEHLPRRNMWLADSGLAGEAVSGKSEFEQSDILFGRLRPYFHKVVSAPFSGVCSTDILVCRPIDQALGGFCLAALTSDLVVAEATASSEGTRMPRVSSRDLGRIEVPWPGREQALALSAQVDSAVLVANSLQVENTLLANLRDSLLPALMSGRLRIEYADDQVKAAV